LWAVGWLVLGWWLVVGCWSLVVTDRWLLAVGSLLLVVGCWLMFVAC
jgi:hypothetical protein